MELTADSINARIVEIDTETTNIQKELGEHQTARNEFLQSNSQKLGSLQIQLERLAARKEELQKLIA